MLGAFSTAILALAIATGIWKDAIIATVDSKGFAGIFLLTIPLAIVIPVFALVFFLLRGRFCSDSWWYRPPLPFIILLGISARIILAIVCFEPYYLQPDSGTYLDLSNLNFSHRVPGYPLFIEIIVRIVGSRSPQLLFPAIVIAQSLVGLAALCLFFYILRRLLKYETIVVVLSCVFATLPYIISWERTLLTESLALFQAVLLIFLLTEYFLRPSPFRAFLLGVFTIPAIFTRPSFVGLLAVLFVLFLSHLFTTKPGRQSIIHGFAGLGVACLVLAGYVYMNGQLYGRPVLTDVSHNNQVTILIFNKLYHNDAYPEAVALIRKGIIDEKKSGLKVAKSLAETFGYEHASKYRRDTLYLHRNRYLSYTFRKFADLTNKDIGCLSSPVSGWVQQTLINTYNSNLFFFTFGQVWGMVLLELAILLYFLCRCRLLLWQSLFICLLIIVISLTSIMGGYGAFERLAVCLIPLTIILAGLLLEHLICSLSGAKNRAMLRFAARLR